MRGFFTFDTSSLTSSASISSAILSLWGNGKNDSLGATPDINIYASTQTNNNNLVTGDYSKVGTTQFSTTKTYANWDGTNTVFNDFTLNASGIANISLTGVSAFSARNANYDVAATSPTWSSGNSAAMQTNYADGGSNIPKLVITYTLVSTISKLSLLGVG